MKKFAKVISSGLFRQLNIIRIFSSKSEVLKVGTTSNEFYQAKAVGDNKGYFYKEPASVY